MTPTREQVLDMSIASGLNDMLRLDSEASRILSVQRIERFAALVHAAARAQALEDAATVCGGISQMASSNAPMLCAERIRALKERAQ